MLWAYLASHIKSAKRVDAAVAFFGTGGAALLPLKKGHRLVVDMSLPTVKKGSTNPQEVDRIRKRGVAKFTRRNLHAKVMVLDGAAIVGSANVSRNSRDVLEEASVLTRDAATVRRAMAYVDSLCTEPVRPEYLALCKRIYKPPKWGTGEHAPASARLWIVSLRSDAEIPEAEWTRYDRGIRKAKAMIKRRAMSRNEDFWWGSRPRMASQLRPGDWVIQVTREGNGGKALVSPPAQFLFMDAYRRAGGKRRYVFHLEAPAQGRAVRWSRFRAALPSVDRARHFRKPHTFPVTNESLVDHVLRLWTVRGAFRA